MGNETNNLESAISVANTFSDFVLSQLKTRKPIEPEDLHLWESDYSRLEKGIKKTNQIRTYDATTDLTNLAVGLLTIYRNKPYRNWKMEKHDILYIGKKHFDRLKGLTNGQSIEHITNYQDAKDKLNDFYYLYRLALEGTGIARTQAEKQFIPRLVISEADLPKTNGSTELVGGGPGLILDIKRNYATPQAYVLVPDIKYDSDETGLRIVCTENNIPIVRESELELRIAEFISHL